MLYAELGGLTHPSAPFVPLPRESVHVLISHISLNNQSVVYDLGCGDGRILQMLYEKNHQQYPDVTYIGVEKNLWAYVVACIRTRHIRSSHFQITCGNIFAADLKQATHVITYLFPKLMDALLPKFTRELSPGTRLYSIDFQLSAKHAVETFDLGRPEKALGRTLYVYEF
jgi:trans-aconitate methyltransferase